MDYAEAGNLRDLASREAAGMEEDLGEPRDEDDAAREELRQLVGRRRDPAPPQDAPLEPADVTGVSSGVALQRLSGKQFALAQSSYIV